MPLEDDWAAERERAIAVMRASLDEAADAEAERVTARIVCPPHRAVTLALDALLSGYLWAERWTSDRCLNRYRQMRR